MPRRGRGRKRARTPDNEEARPRRAVAAVHYQDAPSDTDSDTERGDLPSDEEDDINNRFDPHLDER